MRIREGDPLEIFTDREGEVIFKKYSPIGELGTFASQYAETLHRIAGMAVVICDRDEVIACAGLPKKEYLEKKLSRELEDIAEVLRDTNVLVLSDEIYAEMTYGREHCSIASIEGMKERTIIVSGFSKAYAMTGWRLGYLCAPAPLTEQMLKIHQYCIMSAPTTAQFAAIEAMRNGDEDVQMMVDEYNRRRRYIYNGLKGIGIESFEPEGAFYIFPNIGTFGLTSDEFCSKLLYDYKCAIVPGPAFGAGGEGFARISYAYSIKHITQALERIEAFVKSL